MENNPKISVIVTCYNIAHYLEQCLESIVNQTYTNIEIVIVNDGSTDTTQEVLLKYTALDSRITIINQSNQGVSKARNNGVLAATGDYLLFVDGDDWLSLNTIESLVTISSNFDLICFSYFREYPNEQLPRKLNLESEYSANNFQRRLTGLIGGELKDPSQLDTLSTVWGKLYRTSVLQKKPLEFVDLSEIGTWEDGLFNWDYLSLISKVRVLDQPFYHYRKFNSNSITSQPIDDFLDKRNKLFQLLNDRIVNQFKDSVFHEALKNRICLSIIGTGLVIFNKKTSIVNKYSEIKKACNANKYREAINDFKLNYLPLHWRIFFFFVKYKLVLPMMMMLFVIKKIIDRK